MSDIVLIIDGEYKNERGLVLRRENNFHIVVLEENSLEVLIEEDDLIIIGSTDDYDRETWQINRETEQQFEIVVKLEENE